MEFFATPFAAFITITAITAGYGLILLRVVSHYEGKIKEMENKIDTMRQRMDWQQEILMRNFPAEAVNMNIAGDVNDSTLNAAGRRAGK